MSGSIRVLHVDDDLDFADMAAAFLEREDDRVTVETASGASEGLDRLAAGDVDCVVSDYDMPDTTGIEFLERVRETHPDLPFILFTGKGSEEIASDAIRAGATDYLRKRSGAEQYALLANRVRNAVEQVRAQRRVRRQKRQYRALFDDAPVMYVLVRDEDGHPVIEDCNDRFVETLGYDREDLLGRRTTDFFTEESTAKVYENGGYEQALDGEFGSRERTLVAKDGERIETILRASPRLDEHGNTIGLQTMYLDVTERKERTRRLELAIEHTRSGIWEYDVADGTITRHEGASDLWGDETHTTVPVEEAIAERVHPADRETVRDALDATLSGSDPYRVEFRHETPDGYRWAEARGDVVRDGADDPGRLIAFTTDIDDRKERERELELHETMVETVPDGVYALDQNLEYLAVNEAMTDLTGYTREELIGSHLSLVNDEGVIEKAQRQRERIRSGGIDDRTMVATHPHLTADGDAIPTEVRFRALPPAEDGEFRGTAGVVRDISDRKEYERGLRRYEHIVNTMNEAACIYDEEGRFVTVNEYLAEFYGTTSAALEGEASRLVPHVRSQRDGDPYRELLDGTREELRGEIEGEFRGHGHEVLEYRLTPLRIDGEIDGVVAVAHEITEHRRRERELELYETIVEVSGDAVYALDADGHLTFVNDAFCDLLGYPEAELLDEHVSMVMDEEDIRWCEAVIRDLIRTDETHETLEMDLIGADGDRVVCETHIALLPAGDDGEFRGTTGIHRDITERKRRERELERQNERLEEFASVVSHDLRNPLNVAEGRLELAREECDSEHLDSVTRALDRMDALIDDILTVAREGTAVEAMEPVDLAALVDACWQNVETAAATLVVDTQRTVRADRGRLQQLLENLVRNAIDHGGADVTITVGDLADATGFYLADDGPGIPEGERERVFESGYSTAEEGTGFGLSIVREIAQAHGWGITLTDSADGGARFEITGVDVEDP